MTLEQHRALRKLYRELDKPPSPEDEEFGRDIDSLASCVFSYVTWTNDERAELHMVLDDLIKDDQHDRWVARCEGKGHA